MIVSGSMNYTPSGRKRKVVRTVRKERPFVPLTKKVEHPFIPLVAPKAKAEFKPFTPAEDTSFRKEVTDWRWVKR